MITQAGTCDLEVEQGATFQRTFRVSLSGQFWDFTGYTFRGAIKLRPADASEVLALPNAWFSATSDGYITLTIDKMVTADLPAKQMTWAMRVIQPNTEEYPLLEGTFTVTPRRVNG